MDLKGTGGQFANIWTSLSMRQKLSIGIAALTVAGGLMYFASWRKQQDFRPLFTSMSAEDAGSVVAKLKESGIDYQVTGSGGTILVPSARVAETRLQMAASGLPRSGRIGFELFDKTSLGTTDFAEQVNYRRALEGELERSIRAVSEVEQARVHLTFPKDSVFVESRLPAKASVLLTLRQGVSMTPANVRAVVHLVASAVEGLTPEAVSVTDSLGNLLNRPKKPQTPEEVSDELMEYRQKVERDLLAKANSTLEPLLGSGKYRVGLSVDCDITSGEQSEELYDPEKSVMVTTQKTEESSGSGSSGGVPGTASALPRPAARAGASSNGVTRRTENVTYQSSRTVRRTRLPQGAIRRVSASLVLDQNLRWDLKGGKYERVLTPPGPENIQAIRELVTAALGLNTTRGDQLVIQTLPFEGTLATPPPALPSSATPGKQTNPAEPVWMTWLKDWRIQAGAGAGLLLLLMAAFFLLRRGKPKAATGKIAADAKAALPAGSREAAAAALAVGHESAAVEGTVTNKLLVQAQEKVVQTARVETLVSELRESIGTDPALAASVLRTWLEEAEA